jgi:hypothetical protein
LAVGARCRIVRNLEAQVPHSANEPTDGVRGDTEPPTRKRYQPPTVRTYGSVRDLTLTNATGPNFDGGGGADIYAS